MSDKVRIRMYNVGFGDSFLIFLPGKKTVLVDAGFHSSGVGKFGGNNLAKQIIADVTEFAGKARIDVVIATHRHQDHIYAFNSKEWEDVEVGEVWLPWVEDRKNAKAVALWKKQQAFTANFAAALPAMQLSADARDSIEFILWNAGFNAGAWSNAGALDRLHEGFKRRDMMRPRFLPQTEEFPESFTTPVLPGVRTYVLGPSRDPSKIQELNPSSDGETYRALAMQAAALEAGLAAPAPFGDAWLANPDAVNNVLSDGDIKLLDNLASLSDGMAAATAIDDMINSTSLVLILEIGNARLLLPGDAEWGTWKLILENPDARTLLKSSTFFKVGHHGSHNATSKTLVEEILPAKIPAMISTQEGHGNYRKNIPLPNLLDALTTSKIKVVRSDKPPAKLPAGFTAEPDALWTDLVLDT